MSVGVDVIVVIVLGLCGGFIHTLLYNTDKGFDLPKFDKTKNVYNLGSFDDMLFGIAAALLTYFGTFSSAPPSGLPQLVVLAFTSGIGGSALLIAKQKSS